MEKDYLRVHVGAVSTNQQALDFEGNKRRIFRSIEICKSMGCTYRAGSECEVPGYSCGDHFKELDTLYHCWEVVADLLSSDLTENIVVEMNMPVIHRSVCYNCKILCLNRRIICIRPKTELADEGIYVESRYFVPFKAKSKAVPFALEEFIIPHIVERQTGQKTAPFGIPIIQANDCAFGLAFCRQLWALNNSPGMLAFMNNADFVVSSSALHFEQDTLKHRLNLINNETMRNGGAYIFCNAIGCDGANLYMDGGNLICQNGEPLAVGKYHTLNEIEISTAVLNLQKVRLKRQGLTSGQRQSLDAQKLPIIPINFKLCSHGISYSKPIEISTDPPAKQFVEISSSYLWDYLRKSGGSGYFLPISGGADSTVCALILFHLCCNIMKEIELGNLEVLVGIRQIIKDKSFMPKSPQQIMSIIAHTAYISSPYSGEDSFNRANTFAEKIGCSHMKTEMTNLMDKFQEFAKNLINASPKFKSQGGSQMEDIVLQNLQARLRMMLSYLMAEIIPIKKKLGEGNLLVLATCNVDEAQMGYITKYDTSSGDINPIGSLNKVQVQDILKWFYEEHGWSVLKDIFNAVPTAEQTPVFDGKEQNDEDDLGLTYIELSMISQFRNDKLCGPFSMFDNLNEMWPDVDVAILEDKVKTFFMNYAKNRHKSCVATPPIHLSNHSVESKAKDLRPILYQGFDYQFKKMHKIKNQVKLNRKSKKYFSENISSGVGGRDRFSPNGTNKSSNQDSTCFETYSNMDDTQRFRYR